MKVLANDGISKSGIKALEKGGFEVITTKVAQEQVANFINSNNIDVILVRSATKVRKDIIDACPNLKIIGRDGVSVVQGTRAAQRRRHRHVGGRVRFRFHFRLPVRALAAAFHFQPRFHAVAWYRIFFGIVVLATAHFGWVQWTAH